MFFPNDPTTEIVAHFLGYFELAVEGMRIRLGYEQIEAALAAAAVEPELEQLSAELTQKYALGAFQPGVDYVPPEWMIRGKSPIEVLAPPQPVSASAGIPEQFFDTDLPSFVGGRAGAVAMIGPEPGSVIAIIAQTIALSDNDLVVLGEYHGELVFHSGANTGILMLMEAAQGVTAPFTELSVLHNTADVAAFTGHVAQVIDALSVAEGGPMQVQFVEAIAGNYLNGEQVESLPDMTDTLPAHWRELGAKEEEPEPETGQTVHIAISGDEVQGSVTLNAGGNVLVNEASFFNGGLSSAVFAVGGDLHQLDAIIQTNAYFDSDTVGDDVPGAGANLPGTTTALNAAAFIQEVRDATGAAAEANPGIMPANWQVSVVSGDVVFIEWLSQFTFASDQDMSVLSSTGANVVVTSGENIAFNAVSFANLGMQFDLIIVGGSLYDANVIVQTNVLYDNDTIQMLGEGSAGWGGLSTSGNLLWNDASIHNVGPTNFVDQMPIHYQQAMDGLANGDTGMPAGFLTDEQFEGFQMLRVLYVAGDIYDLRYVEQTNILGDADMVALQKAKLLEGAPDTEWAISTGANALVNKAAITDFDALGDTAYVGGEIYSDAILIQADIMSADAGSSQGDALVTEVIAFLDVEFDAGPLGDASLGPTPLPADGPSADIIQSMLA